MLMTYIIIIIKMRNNNSFIRKKKTNNFTQKHYFNQIYLSKQRDLVFIKKISFSQIKHCKQLIQYFWAVKLLLPMF